MKNDVTKIIPDLMDAAAVAKVAAEEHAADVGLLQNTAGNIGIDLDALRVADDDYERVKAALSEDVRVQQSLTERSRAFLTLARDIFKPTLGSDYSARWDILNLVGSLKIPQAMGEVQSTLLCFKTFLAANSALQNAPLNITAVRAGELFDQLLSARTRVNAQRSEVSRLLGVRDSKMKNLRKRMRGLIGELAQKIDDLDPRWRAFGLNMPGADETPEAPTQLEVVSQTAEAVTVKCEPVPRAERYRGWKRVVGVDEKLLPMNSASEPLLVFAELPRGATIEIAFSAINSGGESSLSEMVLVPLG